MKQPFVSRATGTQSFLSVLAALPYCQKPAPIMFPGDHIAVWYWYRPTSHAYSIFISLW